MVNDKTHLDGSKVHLTLLVFEGGPTGHIIRHTERVFPKYDIMRAHTHTREFQQAIRWPACLSSDVASLENYIACSLLFRIIKGDKAEIWNIQLRTSKKAVTDIITGLYRMWSKRPNNKVTSFPRNNLSLSSSSHLFLYWCIMSSIKRKSDFMNVPLVNRNFEQ